MKHHIASEYQDDISIFEVHFSDSPYKREKSQKMSS